MCHFVRYVQLSANLRTGSFPVLATALACEEAAMVTMRTRTRRQCIADWLGVISDEEM
jgi:hypothetical protein